MSLGAKEAHGTLAIHRGAVEESQDTTYLVVEFFLGIFAAADGLLVGVGHVVAVVSIGLAHFKAIGPCAKLHIEPVLYGFIGIVPATPVAHNHAIELPIALAYAVAKYLVVAVVLVVIEVVRDRKSTSLNSS